jgi:hypothetical protein
VAAESGAVCHGNVSPLVVPMSTYSWILSFAQTATMQLPVAEGQYLKW